MNETAKNQGEESMEDILSSIRETVEEEVAREKKVSGGVSAESNDSDEDVLDLTDMVAEEPDAPAPTAAEASFDADNSAKAEQDLVDINAFAQSGETQEAATDDVEKARARYTGDSDDSDEDELEQEAAAKEDVAADEMALEADEEKPVVEEAPQPEAGDEDMDIDVDSIMAEMADEGMVEAADAEAVANGEEPEKVDIDEKDVDVDALLAETATEEEAPATAEAPTEEAAAEPVDSDAAVETAAESAEEASEESSTEEAASQEEQTIEEVTETVSNAVRKVHLATIPTASGLQLSFPSEVLAEALRPLVSDWIDQNLANVVERLVREELSKLAEK